MKRILTIVSVLAFVIASSAMAEDYGWSLSASNTDPSVNTAAPTGTPASINVYLWLDCVNPALGAGAMECALQITGFFPGSFTALNGALATGAPDLLLAIPCATTPTLLGQQGVLDFGTGGTVCMVNSSNGNNVTVDCDPLDPQLHAHAIHGFSSIVGTDPCQSGSCTIVSVEQSSWGSIKDLYR